MLKAGEDFKFFNPYACVKMTRSNLPHWHQKSALYFVTFRQADAIPAKKLAVWKTQYDQWLNRNSKPWNEAQRVEYETHFARQIEQWLDLSYGSCLLKIKTCRDIIEARITADVNKHYLIDCYTVAVNHVHALIAPKGEHRLPNILKAWKGGSAHSINSFLSRSGPLWQKETYDHIVRNQIALNRIRSYITAHDRT